VAIAPCPVTGHHWKESEEKAVYGSLSRLTKAMVLWLGSHCPEVIVRGNGIFMDNPECLKVRAGGFNTQWIPGAYKSLSVEACTLIWGVFCVHSIILTNPNWQ